MNDNNLKTIQCIWQTVGTVSSTDTTPPVAERGYAAVAALANTSIWTAGRDENIGEFRFAGDTNGDDFVVDVYASRGEDSFTLVCTLTMVVGQQVISTGLLAVDTITISAEAWLKEITEVNGETDKIGRIVLDLCGYDKWAFVPTTLDGPMTIQASGF